MQVEKHTSIDRLENPVLWNLINTVLTIGSLIADQKKNQTKTEAVTLERLDQALEQILAIYNQGRKNSQLEMTPDRSVTETIAFSLTAFGRKQKRQQKAQEVDELFGETASVNFQRRIFKIREVIKTGLLDATKQHDLLIRVGELAQHPFIEPFSQKHLEKQASMTAAEHNFLRQLQSASPETVDHFINDLFSRVQMDKNFNDLSDSFSTTNPEYGNVLYFYDVIGTVDLVGDKATKAVLILAKAIEYEETHTLHYTLPYGNEYAAAFLWALATHRLKNS